jgi:hypothetical protein
MTASLRFGGNAAASTRVRTVSDHHCGTEEIIQAYVARHPKVSAMNLVDSYASEKLRFKSGL